MSLAPSISFAFARRSSKLFEILELEITELNYLR